MSITHKDIKFLWGRAAGRCSAPGCRIDLTPILEESGSIVIGEMAHKIGRKQSSARSDKSVGEDNSYDNLILLCPNHHTIIDKAEADYPIDMLRKWKSDWENQVSSMGVGVNSPADLFRSIQSLLISNHTVFEEWGPKSKRARAAPQSTQAAVIWQLRRVGVIIPNNRTIINLLKTNDEHLDRNLRRTAQLFIEHAEFFEDHCFDPKDATAYLPFPGEFADQIQRMSENG